MANEITLSVNGTKQVVSAAPETPLLFVLRNELKLTGPRLGCGMAQCGACSVLLDGEEVRACITPISYAVGKQVTTIEGLPAVWAAEKSLSAIDAAKTLHPVQQAWIDEQVPQCGYCQSGMMIAAVQLLAKNPNPSVAQIKDAFTNTPPSPHLCRCGTYAAIIDAVQRAAKGMTAFYAQMIAEELSVRPEAITLILGDTDKTPDGGYSAGFLTGAANVRKVAAYTYQALLGLAASQLGVPASALTVTDGIVSGG